MLYILPTTYDDTPLKGYRYQTKSGLNLCQDCVCGNRSACADPYSEDWFVIGHEKCSNFVCDNCAERGIDGEI